MPYPNPIRAFHCLDQCQEIAVGAAASPDSLPATMVVAPGVYTALGRQIDMATEGLYRITNFAGSSVQVISYASDIDALIRGIAWLSQHGDADDDSTSAATSLARARTRTVSHTCGDVGPMAQAILTQAGVQSRVVNGLTMQPLNGYDNGHTLLEIIADEQWCLIDPDSGVDYWVPDGSGGVKRASLLDVRDHLSAGDVTVRPLTNRLLGCDAKFGLAWLYDALRSNPLLFVQREFAIPYIWTGSQYHALCETSAETERATSYSPAFVPMSRAAFVAAYYSGLPAPEVHYGATANTLTGWGGVYTIVDRSMALIPGKTVASIGVFLNQARSDLVVKIFKENAPGNYDVVHSSAPGSHPGGGWYGDIAVSPNFVVPSTGTYRVGICANLPSTPAEAFCTAGARALKVGNAVGAGVTFSAASDGTIAMRWMEAA